MGRLADIASASREPEQAAEPERDSRVTGRRPGSDRRLKVGMVFHGHSRFTGTGRSDGFISDTVMPTPEAAETPSPQTPDRCSCASEERRRVAARAGH